MRSKARWRMTRPAQLTIATTMLAVPASAIALTTAALPQTPADAQTPLKIDVEPVRVAPQLRVSRRSFDLLSGQRMDLRGRMLPPVAGRRLRLQARAGHAWDTLATTRTGARGAFDLHYRPATAGQRSLRVLFSGDRLNVGASRPAGKLTVYDLSVASWYVDAGSTACGFHATFGVANRDLPCGARVGFRYGGRSVTAVVDDRGPFVGGRDWDLNQNTAAALGFGGVGTVWSTA